MEETPIARPLEPMPLRRELVAEEAEGCGATGRFRCVLRNQSPDEPMGRGTAEDAYRGLLHEGSVGGQLLLLLDRFGAGRVRWELRACAGGRVEWLHDEHGAEPRSWNGEADFADFWAGLSERAASDAAAHILGLPGAGAGAGLALSGQSALGSLRGLAARQRRRLEAPAFKAAQAKLATSTGPSVPQFVPRPLKLILPPSEPLDGAVEKTYDYEPWAATQQTSVKLILPPWPASSDDEQGMQKMQDVDFGRPSIKVLLPPAAEALEVLLPPAAEALEAWHSSKPTTGQAGLRIALLA